MPATIKNHKNKSKCVKFTGNKFTTLTTKCKYANGLGRPLLSDSEFLVDKPFNYTKVHTLTINECEKLQTFPVVYTLSAIITERYKMLGNSWTVDVISHILRHIKQENI